MERNSHIHSEKAWNKLRWDKSYSNWRKNYHYFVKLIVLVTNALIHSLVVCFDCEVNLFNCHLEVVVLILDSLVKQVGGHQLPGLIWIQLYNFLDKLCFLFKRVLKMKHCIFCVENSTNEVFSFSEAQGSCLILKNICFLFESFWKRLDSLNWVVNHTENDIVCCETLTFWWIIQITKKLFYFLRFDILKRPRLTCFSFFNNLLLTCLRRVPYWNLRILFPIMFFLINLDLNAI